MSPARPLRGKQPRHPVAAGETRSLFGHALDRLLPLPEQRKRLRRWRHTRPFWGGVFAILGGVVIISYPLGPLPSIMAIGTAALTGITMGLILVIGGLFFFFAPHQRMFVSIVLMLVSILSLVVTNLGGFFLGMLLGMLGSAMGFGWKPDADYARKGSPASETEPAAPESTEPGPAKPSPVPRGSSGTKGTVAVLAVGAMLAAAVTYPGAAEPALALDDIAPAGCGSTPVDVGTLRGKQVTIVETTMLPSTGQCPPREVVHLFVGEADLTEYRLQSPVLGTGDALQLSADLHLERFHLYTTQLNTDLNLSTVLPGADLPLPSKALPITPQLVGVLDTANVLPLTLPTLNADDSSLTQPYISGVQVDLSNFRIAVVGVEPSPASR